MGDKNVFISFKKKSSEKEGLQLDQIEMCSHHQTWGGE